MTDKVCWIARCRGAVGCQADGRLKRAPTGLLRAKNTIWSRSQLKQYWLIEQNKTDLPFWPSLLKLYRYALYRLILLGLLHLHCECSLYSGRISAENPNPIDFLGLGLNLFKASLGRGQDQKPPLTTYVKVANKSICWVLSLLPACIHTIQPTQEALLHFYG